MSGFTMKTLVRVADCGGEASKAAAYSSVSRWTLLTVRLFLTAVTKQTIVPSQIDPKRSRSPNPGVKITWREVAKVQIRLESRHETQSLTMAWQSGSLRASEIP